MKIKDFEYILALDLCPSRNEVGHTVLAAGPLTKQPGTQSYRVVLVENGKDEFVVWDEIFEQPDNLPIDSRYSALRHRLPLAEGVKHPQTRSYFTNGGYFPVDQLGRAIKLFAKRVGQHATKTVSSILY